MYVIVICSNFSMGMSLFQFGCDDVVVLIFFSDGFVVSGGVVAVWVVLGL